MPEFGLAFISIETIIIFLISRLLGEILKKSKLKFIDIILNFRFLILMLISILLIAIKIYSVLKTPDNGEGDAMVRINAVLFFILCTLIMIIYFL